MLRQELARLAREVLADPVAGAPEVEFTVAPETGEDAASILGFAATNQMRVLFWGAGTHQSMGYPIDPDIVMTTAGLSQIVDWQVEDLTVVVEPGVTVADLEDRLGDRNQTAVLPEMRGQGTVGGAVAAGLSGWRRLRYGPTRDRMLEVRLATGDGRLIRGGGRLVKNVTGYDLPRLAAGSFGSLGLITEVCLKLWPLPQARAMIRVSDPAAALDAAYRPQALLATPAGATLYVAGSEAEVEAQAERVGGELVSGHEWPDPLSGATELSLRCPPSSLAAFVDRVHGLGADYQAAYGVGEIRFVADNVAGDDLVALRNEVEAAGGALVIIQGTHPPGLDPWGSPPPSIELQRSVKAAFDPRAIANPGRLPGGI